MNHRVCILYLASFTQCYFCYLVIVVDCHSHCCIVFNCVNIPQGVILNGISELFVVA